MDRAFEILRERGLAASEKKASRIAAEGAVIAYTDEDAKVTVLLEINSETDSLVRTRNSRNSVLALLKQLLLTNPLQLKLLQTSLS
jgi:elongation factor Ts